VVALARCGSAGYSLPAWQWRFDCRSRATRQTLTADGTGLLLLSYRGYEGSSGAPSEEVFATDALAAFDWIKARQPDAPIVLYGKSLGSGVAVRLAPENRSPA
jgi:alpha/beta superfamily hydrolase